MNEQQPEICLVKSGPDSTRGAWRFSHEAMGTTFEIFILYPKARYARQAAHAAFSELDRLEQELSRFIENSDISRINNLSVNQSLVIGQDVFECLKFCGDLYKQTNGAFDITIGSLMSCWLSEDKKILRPSKGQLNRARQRTGMELVKLNEAGHTVRLLSEGVQIDLGGIGKGYALDRMAELLGGWSIDAALIHGGASSVLALGAPPSTSGWRVTLSSPSNQQEVLARLDLHNLALGASGLQKGRHIIDPRTASPVEGKRAAWACTTDAATADSLSTAFMVMSPTEIEQFCASHPGTLALVVTEKATGDSKKEKVLHFGQWKTRDLLRAR